jgi:hypothetical protein
MEPEEEMHHVTQGPDYLILISFYMKAFWIKFYDSNSKAEFQWLI